MTKHVASIEVDTPSGLTVPLAVEALICTAEFGGFEIDIENATVEKNVEENGIVFFETGQQFPFENERYLDEIKDRILKTL
jgi:hypothetical protein